MQPRNNFVPLEAFMRAPLMRKLVILAQLVVNGEEGFTATAKLIGLASVMASFLSAEARIAIAEELRAEADNLAPPYDRRALH